jgi:chemotaxis protein histidine kinase CheA
VVVKPLGPVFRAARAVSGCAVSGDGSMALVLDVAGLFLAALQRRAARPVAPSVSLQ